MDRNNPTEVSLFPEGLKVICRTCPYTCSIREIVLEEVDSDSTEENNDHNDIASSQADPHNELSRYTQTVMEEIRQLQGGQIPCFLADKLYPDQAFQFPSRATNPRLNNPPLQLIAKDLLRKGIEDALYNALTPTAKEALEKPSIGLAELIDIGGSPERDEGTGIYLHILKAHTLFYLYVGQGIVFSERISFHNDPAKRARHPSLHYKIWELLEKMDGFESIFVKLATFDDRPRGPAEQLPLNLQEMFLACVLQTLKPSDLEIWLPEDEGAQRPWAGLGLNIALPLWQGYSSEDNVPYDQVKMTGTEFSAMLRDSDGLRRQWAIAVRDAYQSLRTHPDSRIQGLWFSDFRKFLEARITDSLPAGYHTHQIRAREGVKALFAGKSLQMWQTQWGYYHAQYCDYAFTLRHIKRFSLDQYVAEKSGKKNDHYGKSAIRPQGCLN
ncbi:hypothetical protein E8E15_004065 [Penicillium rubens]|nr:hypothetical protein E8E15_004065 [Penicillium rubens]